MHHNADRKTFKKEWDLWKEANKPVLDAEIERIQASGYDGDVLQKLFTSVRYYYRKKQSKEEEEEEATSPPQRKEYQSFPKFILNDMDKHIREHILHNHSPAESYLEYTKQSQYDSFLNDPSLLETYSRTELIQKIKKTYKNRFHVDKKKSSSS